MEEKKKLSVFDIANICILGAGVILTIITLLTGPQEEIEIRILPVISNIAAIVALISGVIYMLLRYTKKGAFLYKIYMFAFVVVAAMAVLNAMTIGSGDLLASVIILVIMILSVILATAKGFGKVKTFIVAGLLLIGQAIVLIKAISSGANVLPYITCLILIIEACIMVLAKYRDKAARGVK